MVISTGHRQSERPLRSARVYHHLGRRPWRGARRVVSARTRFRSAAAVSVLLVLTLPTGSAAQTITTSSQRSQVGFTGGLSIDPEQGFVGVFWRSPEIGGRFHQRPGLDGGFGEHVKLATINLDFVARIPLGSSGWEFLQGGGPAIVIARFNGFGGSLTDVGAGGSYVLGFAHDSGFLGEFRVGGGGNVPSLKLSAGYAIGF